jgi:hypothetical protein
MIGGLADDPAEERDRRHEPLDRVSNVTGALTSANTNDFGSRDGHFRH